MISKIVLENFMAHKHTEVELGPGVNALTGPNNTGKSALVEGLRCVATNPKPKHFIRHGAREARVTLEFSSGEKVVWIRKKNSSGYELWHSGAESPQEYWKFGRRPPEDILAVLRLNLVELETGDPIDVHIGNQRDPIFLLNLAGSHAAAFFAASTESAHLLAMQSLLKTKTTEAKRREKSLCERQKRLATQLSDFACLPDIEFSIEGARKLEIELKQLERTLPQLEDCMQQQQVLMENLVAKQTYMAMSEQVQPPPEIWAVNELAKTVDQVSSLQGALESLKGIQSVLVGLHSVPEQENVRHLAQLLNQIEYNEAALKQSRMVHRSLVNIEEPPQVENCLKLNEIIREIVWLEGAAQSGETCQTLLQKIASPPAVETPVRLESLLAEMQSVLSMKKTVAGKKEQLELQLGRLQREIKEKVAAVGNCPTCGHEMNGDDFLKKGCEHDA